MTARVWGYPFDIDSVANAHGLPANLDMFAIGIRARKQAGDPFDPTAAAQAEATAEALVYSRGEPDPHLSCATPHY